MLTVHLDEMFLFNDPTIEQKEKALKEKIAAEKQAGNTDPSIGEKQYDLARDYFHLGDPASKQRAITLLADAVDRGQQEATLSLAESHYGCIGKNPNSIGLSIQLYSKLFHSENCKFNRHTISERLETAYAIYLANSPDEVHDDPIANGYFPFIDSRRYISQALEAKKPYPVAAKKGPAA